jgi:hypothetical protein
MLSCDAVNVGRHMPCPRCKATISVVKRRIFRLIGRGKCHTYGQVERFNFKERFHSELDIGIFLGHLRREDLKYFPSRREVDILVHKCRKLTRTIKIHIIPNLVTKLQIFLFRCLAGQWDISVIIVPALP